MRLATYGFLLASVVAALLAAPVSTNSSSRVILKSSRAPGTPIDLALLGNVASKGRLQDPEYNPHLQAQIDSLVACGPAAVDFLISKIGDDTLVHHHVFDYWRQVHVGDVALVTLSDLFTQPSGRGTTIPGASLDEILERRHSALPAYDLLAASLERNGRRALQSKWAALWGPYRSSVAWDSTDRCFRPTATPRDPQATAPN